MKIRWAPIAAICRDAMRLGTAGMVCWVEDAKGKVVAGVDDSPERASRHPIRIGEEEVATVCVVGPQAEEWGEYLASVIGREISHQHTVADMADAQARLWRHTNALMRMAACMRLSLEPARVIDSVLGILARATNLGRGTALVRLPGSDTYSAFRPDGVEPVEPLLLAPLYAISDEVRLVTMEDAADGVMHACSEILGTYEPVAVARLGSERGQLGFVLAPVAAKGGRVTSEDLKMLSAAARMITTAVENGYTLAGERDATRLQVENELLAEQARTMEEMLHTVAHDLRSPMTALYGFLHLSLEELKDMRRRLEEEGFAAIGPYADDVAEPLRDSIRSVEKLNRMVQRLLEFSRAARATYSFEKVDLDRVVRGVVRSLGYQIKKNDIRVEIGKLPIVTADREQLEAVFGNLVDNAIKYMGDGPTRTIAIGCLEGPEPVFYVRDTGIGMTPEEVSKAFLPFQRFRRDAAPGDGIGLSHVRKIIERHGGRIWCESERGVGTTFYFTLGTTVGRRVVLPHRAVEQQSQANGGTSEQELGQSAR
ncbi:MAG: sensor histidine kinase [Candidatus Dadabacteria bacterium]|nr:MAG: sensor histidine kinase [Candidatus Dadabacteria bacterium]